jgi:hypothetical protein
MFSVGKITKYWLILFKIEVEKIILFVSMTGKKLNYCKLSTHICKCWSFCECPGERIIAN